MKWTLLLRDSVLLIAGVGIIAQQIWTGHPDLMVLEFAAALTGIPALQHTRFISRIGSGRPSSPDSVSPQDQESQSPMQ